ncbi:HNH endonuclease signature motif containing protein [Corynebacterium aquatimens]|uniref:HNH nuclease domain-containing protein n=1 Tax=Corynebacterium aquatimens TaxID=1190508 RepID=A0A931E0T4_9CORY|nr:HNH endonuclease signature motif containing protein [Corynebacterium aquatimens]MBG6122614.1 hypothetical protein [Corynebacterium aquatimens]
MINSCKARLLRLLGELDEERLADLYGTSSLSTLLIRHVGVSRSTAFEYTSVARRLRQFPGLLDALEDGEIHYSTLRFLLKYITPANQGDLLALAKKLSHEDLRKALAGYDTNDDGTQPEHFLRIRDEDNGDVTITARLNATDGAMFKAALKTGEAAYFGTPETASQDDGENAENSRPQRVSGFGMPVGRSLLAALMGIVHIARDCVNPPLRTPGAQVNLVVNLDGHIYMPSNPKAPSKSLTRLIGSALGRLEGVNDKGVSLHLGRGHRLASPGQVNALLRYWHEQCAMPGCTHTRFIEIHHITSWADGGETNIDNLLPLCSACHSMVTDGCISIEKQGQDTCFFFPDGSAFVSREHGHVHRDDSRRPTPALIDADSFDDSIFEGLPV